MKNLRAILCCLSFIASFVIVLPSCDDSGSRNAASTDDDDDTEASDDDDDTTDDDDTDDDTSDDDDDTGEVETFTIAVELDGEGSVTLDPDKESYEAGELVTLEAVPSEGSTFANWTGDLTGEEPSKEVTIQGDMSVTAHFVKAYILAIEIVGEGTVAVDPDKEQYEAGEVITLTATGAEGWTFTKWTGGISSVVNPVHVTMNTDKTITATFLDTAGKTFFSSCVNDGLSATDRTVMENKMESMGYEILGSNTNISSSIMKTKMADATIYTYYHTGHGSEGAIMTSDGQLSVTGVTTIAVTNLIVCTCLTMTPTTWMNKMSATSYNVFGYTMVSYDSPVDDNVAQAFGTQLAAGKTYIQAWYTANNSNSNVSDRWLGYVREDSGVVEYSARSGNAPAKAGDTFSQESEKVMVAAGVLADTRTFESEFSVLASYDYTLAGDRSLSADFFRDSPEFLAKTHITETEAEAAALDWLTDKLPSDAQLTAVIPIDAAEQSDDSSTVAYAFRYGRRVNGLPIMTNGSSIYLEVLVNDGQVVGSSTIWPELTVQDISRPNVITNLLPVNEAVEDAIEAIDSIAKKTLKIVDVEACLGVSDNKLVPAYAVVGDDGAKIIIDARTAELLN